MDNSGQWLPSKHLLWQCSQIFLAELVIDIAKHAVVGKFNEIRPGVYREFMKVPTHPATAAASAADACSGRAAVGKPVTVQPARLVRCAGLSAKSQCSRLPAKAKSHSPANVKSRQCLLDHGYLHWLIDGLLYHSELTAQHHSHTGSALVGILIKMQPFFQDFENGTADMQILYNFPSVCV